MILVLQLGTRVSVFTPQFAIEVEHCFYFETQLKAAACCLLFSPAQGEGRTEQRALRAGAMQGSFAPHFRPAFLEKPFLSHSTMFHN